MTQFTIVGNTTDNGDVYHPFTIGSTVRLADTLTVFGKKLYHAGGAVLVAIEDKDLEAVAGAVEAAIPVAEEALVEIEPAVAEIVADVTKAAKASKGA
jgi:hypothetical protein